VKIHVKVDTGMSRLGFYFQDIERDKEAVSVVAEACRRPGLIPEGIFTHFAVADGGENGKAFTLKQFSCFMALIVELEKQGITFKIHHCANSGAILDYPEMHLDMVRAGVILYGMEPSLSVEHHADFRPVLSLHSVISHVKEIEPRIGHQLRPHIHRKGTHARRDHSGWLRRRLLPQAFEPRQCAHSRHALPDFR